MKVAYYDAENHRLSHLETHPAWTPQDVRLLVLTIQAEEDGFDDLDWFLAWDDAAKVDPWRSVFFLCGEWPAVASEQRIEQAFALAMDQ